VKNVRDNHVSEKQLIRAVIDPADPPVELREHLNCCPLCRIEQERLEAGLAWLGHLAQEYAPAPPRISLSAPEPVRPRRAFSWSFAAAMAVVLLIVLAWWAVPFIKSPSSRLEALTLQMNQDAELLAEIEYLEDNPLPVAFADISGESSSDLNEDFLEFVAPFEDNEQPLIPPFSRRGQGSVMALSPRGGVQLCCMPYMERLNGPGLSPVLHI
jgi:hypothetical protein